MSPCANVGINDGTRQHAEDGSLIQGHSLMIMLSLSPRMRRGRRVSLRIANSNSQSASERAHVRVNPLGQMALREGGH